MIMSRTARGNVLVAAGGDASEAGLALLAQVKADILQERFSHSMLGAIDTITAEMMTKAGDLDGASPCSTPFSTTICGIRARACGH